MGDGVALLIVQPVQQRIDICVIDEAASGSVVAWVNPRSGRAIRGRLVEK